LITAQRVDFIAVPARNRALLAEFYEDTLGLERSPTSTESWIEFETGNVALAIVEPRDAGVEFAPLPFGTIALRVPDVEAAKSKLTAAGVAFAGETWDSGVCNGAAFTDPDGNGIVVHHRYKPYLDGRSPDEQV
jgi:predicted enzyme related to lactoylglutathione lyase